MFRLKRRDIIVPLDVPASSPGAPLPIVLADEFNVLVAFIADRIDPKWDGTYARVVGPESGGEHVVIVRFQMPSCRLWSTKR